MASKFENCLKRQKWERFGDAKSVNNFEEHTQVCDDTWMEYNEEVYKSKRTRSYITSKVKDYGGDGSNEEKYGLMNCDDEHFDSEMRNIGYYKMNALKHLNKLICNFCSGDHWTKDCKSKEFYLKLQEIENKQTEALERKKQEKIENSSYVPPTLRKTDIILDEKKSIRLINIPTNIPTDGLQSWLNKYNIMDKYRISRPKDKFNGGFRDFIFLNFNSNMEATKTFELLNSTRMRISHYIITVEWARY
jgi:hypothetical protein